MIVLIIVKQKQIKKNKNKAKTLNKKKLKDEAKKNTHTYKKERKRKKRKKKTNSLKVRACDLTVALIEIIIRKKREKGCPEKSYQNTLQVAHSDTEVFRDFQNISNSQPKSLNNVHAKLSNLLSFFWNSSR